MEARPNTAPYHASPAWFAALALPLIAGLRAIQFYRRHPSG